MHAPKFWFQNIGLRSKLLWPLSLLWQAKTRSRLKQSGIRINIPVICVGNISMGGTGKTPTAIFLAQKLSEAGFTPYILTRGYGGKLDGPIRVIDEHTAKDIGDEAVLMNYFAPVIVAKNRAEGGVLAENLGADVLIMDDGFQNPSLEKDLSIVVIDSDLGLGNRQIFPSGPLRESFADAEKRADMFLLIGNGARKSDIVTKLPVIEARLSPVEMGVNWSQKRLYAFAGIGRPEKFFSTLKSLDANVICERSFGDHEEIPLMILQRMENEAKALSAQLITTEKDAARLPEEWKGKVLCLPVRLEITTNDLIGEVLKRLKNEGLGNNFT